MTKAYDPFAENKRRRDFTVTVKGYTRFVASGGESADVTFIVPLKNGGTRALEHGGFPLADVEWAPEPLKVGDTVEGEAAYAALPVGAVVAGEPGESRVYVRGQDGWRNTGGELAPKRAPMFWPRTLVYLPE